MWPILPSCCHPFGAACKVQMPDPTAGLSRTSETEPRLMVGTLVPHEEVKSMRPFQNHIPCHDVISRCSRILIEKDETESC
jgi:hypothetical protein